MNPTPPCRRRRPAEPPSRPVWHRWLLAGLLLWSGLARAESVREIQLKAAVLYNFTKFVVWPDAAFPAADSPVVIGTYGGAGSLREELERVVAGRRLNARPYLVRSVANIDEARAAHLLYVGSSDSDEIERLLAPLGRAPVLVVGDSATFLDRGGAIQLLVVKDKIAFDIDVSRAHAAGLQLSAQLQKLAREVRRAR